METRTFITPKTIAAIVLIPCVVLVLALISAYSHNANWSLVWSAIGAISSFISISALFLAAAFALTQTQVMHNINKVNLTARVLESDWLTRAIDAFNSELRDNNYDLDATKAAVSILLTAQFQTLDAQRKEQATAHNRAIGSYLYLALLYNVGVLENDLVRKSGGLTVAAGMYVYGPLIQVYVDRGIYGDDIFVLGRTCLADIKKLTNLPYWQLRNFTI